MNNSWETVYLVIGAILLLPVLAAMIFMGMVMLGIEYAFIKVRKCSGIKECPHDTPTCGICNPEKGFE